MSYLDIANRGLRVEAVETSEGVAHVRVLSGRERAALEKEWASLTGDDLTAILIARTVCDNDGKRHYESVETADALAKVHAVDSTVNMKVAAKALKLNGFGQQAIDDEKKD